LATSIGKISAEPYGNSLIVNGAYLAKNPKLVEDFVKISQKAYAACVADVEPCLKALLDQAPVSTRKTSSASGSASSS
jgi:ABC-type nitrate/sulfonate/bicarbonate transport system substrate-binding protein